MLRGPYKKTMNDVRQRLCAAYQSGQVLTTAADVIGIGRQTKPDELLKDSSKKTPTRKGNELLIAMNNVHNVITPEDCNNYVAKVNDNCYKCANNGVDVFDN